MNKGILSDVQFDVVFVHPNLNCNFLLKSAVFLMLHIVFALLSPAGTQAPLHRGNNGGRLWRLFPSLSSNPLPSQPAAAQPQQPGSSHVPGEPSRRRTEAVQRPAPQPFAEPQPRPSRADLVPSAANKKRAQQPFS